MVVGLYRGFLVAFSIVGHLKLQCNVRYSRREKRKREIVRFEKKEEKRKKRERERSEKKEEEREREREREKKERGILRREGRRKKER